MWDWILNAVLWVAAIGFAALLLFGTGLRNHLHQSMQLVTLRLNETANAARRLWPLFALYLIYELMVNYGDRLLTVLETAAS